MEFTWLCDTGINWENRLLKIYDKTGLSGRGRLFFKANGERTALQQRICNADNSTMALDYEISKECRILCGKFIYSR